MIITSCGPYPGLGAFENIVGNVFYSVLKNKFYVLIDIQYAILQIDAFHSNHSRILFL